MRRERNEEEERDKGENLVELNSRHWCRVNWKLGTHTSCMFVCMCVYIGVCMWGRDKFGDREGGRCRADISRSPSTFFKVTTPPFLTAFYNKRICLVFHIKKNNFINLKELFDNNIYRFIFFFTSFDSKVTLKIIAWCL